jgi:hypothetical protein
VQEHWDGGTNPLLSSCQCQLQLALCADRFASTDVTDQDGETMIIPRKDGQVRSPNGWVVGEAEGCCPIKPCRYPSTDHSLSGATTYFLELGQAGLTGDAADTTDQLVAESQGQ